MDSRFLSKFWQALMYLLQCTLAISSGYHPQTDCQSECSHYSLEQILYCYMTASQSNWVVALASAAFALNSIVSLAHGKSPFVVLFRQEHTLPRDLAMTKFSNYIIQAVSDFISCQEKSFSDICMALTKTNKSMASSADKYHCDVQFHSGDLVYINTAHFSLVCGLSRQLALKWVGLFFIEQIISLVVYFINLPEKGVYSSSFSYFFFTQALQASTFTSPSCFSSS